jgi:hypothetical protein
MNFMNPQEAENGRDRRHAQARARRHLSRAIVMMLAAWCTGF